MRTIHLPALLPLLGSLSGCVVPAGPEWSDPQENYPPTIHSASPAVGSVLALDPDAGGSFKVEVVLADQNTQDKLYIRWIIDYPPFVDGVSRLAYPITLPAEGQVLRSKLSFTPSCSDDQIAPGFTNHRLMLAVSDRPFSNDPTQATPDQVPAGNSRVEGMWQFEMDCP